MKRNEENTSAVRGNCQRIILRHCVNRVEVLCDHDRELMTEFSLVCVRRLGKYLPLKFFLSMFHPVLDANVHKEIEKDRLIITHAAAGFDSGQDKAAVDVDGLFEATREIDTEFVRKLTTPFFSIRVRYEDFIEVRKRRIVSLVGVVFDLMGNWRDKLPLAGNLRNTYTDKRYKEVLCELLHLYNVETRMLSNSFTFHGPGAKLKDLFAERLFVTMEETAEDLCSEFTMRVYGEGGHPSQPPSDE